LAVAAPVRGHAGMDPGRGGPGALDTAGDNDPHRQLRDRVVGVDRGVDCCGEGVEVQLGQIDQGGAAVEPGQVGADVDRRTVEATDGLEDTVTAGDGEVGDQQLRGALLGDVEGCGSVLRRTGGTGDEDE